MAEVAEIKRLPIRRQAARPVVALTDDERTRYGLSTERTIVEVVGTNALVRQACAYARSKGKIQFDCETTGLNPHRDRIVLVQIGDSERQYLIWYDTVDPAPITELLRDDAVCKMGSNLKFDLKMWLTHNGLDARAWNVADAQLVEQIIGCGLLGEPGQVLGMTGMAQQAKSWLGLELPKDEDTRTRWGDMIPGNWTTFRDGTPIPDGKKKRYYAADDVCVPGLVLAKQRDWLEMLGLEETVILEMAFLPILAEVEVRGIKIDVDKWRALYNEASDNLKYAEEALDRLFDVTQTIRIDEDGVGTLTRDKNYQSNDALKQLIHDWMLANRGVHVIATNAQMQEALRSAGRIAQQRMEVLFKPTMLPDPAKPGKKRKVAYPTMNDVVEQYWDMYRYYLPPKAFRLPNTDSKTLKLLRIVADTQGPVDTVLGTDVGLPSELVTPILNMRENQKRKGTYGDKWFARIEPATGRLHVDFLQCALATGRLSSSPNIQNPPRDERYRAAYVAEPDRVFVGRDFSQIEPRVLAQMSQEPTYMRVFWSERPNTAGFRRWCSGVRDVLDLYTEIGKLVGVVPFGYTKLDCKTKEDGKKGRQQSKVIVLGLGYGTGVPKFHRMLIIDTGAHHTFDYARKLHQDFWTSVPKLKEALDISSQLANPEFSKRRVFHPFTGCEVTWSETIGGRKRFFHPDNANWWTQARNMPVQGTAGADILKATAVLFTHWLWEQGIQGGIVNLIHDEYIVEVPEADAQDCLDKLGELMTYVGEHYCPDVPISSTGYIDTKWVKD